MLQSSLQDQAESETSLEISTSSASSPSLSCFPHSLTGFSWAYFLIKLLTHESLSQAYTGGGCLQLKATDRSP